MPVGAVRASTYNPRAVDPARLDLIELSLRKLGFLIPVYADPSGEVISGHQRLTVAERMGLELVPVETTRPMDLAERKGVNIACNRGTNDLRSKDTPTTLTEALGRIDLDALAAELPDREPGGPGF